MIHNPDIAPDSHPASASREIIGKNLSVVVTAEELAGLLDADSSLGFIPDIGATDFEAGASVNLDPSERPSLFASITDEAIF